MSASKQLRRLGGALFFACLITASDVPAGAQGLPFMPIDRPGTVYQPLGSQPDAAIPDGSDVPAALQRQVVTYPSNEAPGTVIIDTAHTFLYLILGNGRAMRYGIGVGRQGFTWSGVETITRKAEWPDWIPPAQMVARQPYLPRWVGGGPGNPLGARALYLGHTDYRIHGTNDPTSIGQRVSSGCIRLRNEDVIDLYSHVDIGTKVVVLPAADHRQISDERGPAMTVGQPLLHTIYPQARIAPRDGGALSGIY
jgi:lipoprotein-anchoring transpeptidase ErfK/SrfK